MKTLLSLTILLILATQHVNAWNYESILGTKFPDNNKVIKNVITVGDSMAEMSSVGIRVTMSAITEEGILIDVSDSIPTRGGDSIEPIH
jgi:hypothetical protein